MTLSDVTFEICADLPDADDIVRCLQTLLMTQSGTVPLCRDFGIDQNILDRPLAEAKSLLAVEVIEKAARYEPRANIKAVDLTADNSGQLRAKVVI